MTGYTELPVSEDTPQNTNDHRTGASCSFLLNLKLKFQSKLFAVIKYWMKEVVNFLARSIHIQNSFQ